MMNDTTNTNPLETSSASAEKKPEPQTGRNEPCPCGSGKKFKRCHGVDAAPKLTAPTAPAMPSGPLPGGFDPSQMDPAMMQQMAKSLQRLPRAQLTKLQSIMQRAMSGQDVTQEAAQFERMLPPEFQQMAMQMMMAQNMASAGGAAPVEEKPMDADAAKVIVAKAVAEGKMTAEQAKELLGGEDPQAILEKSEKKGISKFFGKLAGK
jgi:uncharacterized protein YecA (UPF0149 family)